MRMTQGRIRIEHERLLAGVNVVDSGAWPQRSVGAARIGPYLVWQKSNDLEGTARAVRVRADDRFDKFGVSQNWSVVESGPTLRIADA